MKSGNKVIFTTAIALLAICVLSVFASVANAQTNTSHIISISSNNNGVNGASSYSITVKNTGTSNIGAVNVTVPLGYANVANLALTQQPPSQTWNIDYIPPATVNGQTTPGIITLVNQTGQGLTNGQSVTFTFDATNPQVAGNYAWVSNAVGSDSTQTTATLGVNIVIASILPALAILGIAAGIAFLNSGLNRFLINYFIGWEQYRVMQKEMAEYRSETMAAARANDKKQMEKLKKRQSQINNMQSKMLKPQIVQFGISFVYLIVWFLVLTPTFQSTSMAYVPGFGPIPVFYLYPILSIFLGLLSSRIIGIMPIEP